MNKIHRRNFCNPSEMLNRSQNEAMCNLMQANASISGNLHWHSLKLFADCVSDGSLKCQKYSWEA